MQKKTTDTLTMTSNYRHIKTQTGLIIVLTRLDQKFKRLRKLTTDKEEKRKSPHSAFLKISANPHCTHLQSCTSQPTSQALQKSAIPPNRR